MAGSSAQESDTGINNSERAEPDLGKLGLGTQISANAVSSPVEEGTGRPPPFRIANTGPSPNYWMWSMKEQTRYISKIGMKQSELCAFLLTGVDS